MHRFFSPSLKPHLENIVIDHEDEARHIARVLRLRPGEEIELANGCGLLARARLVAVSKHGVEAELLSVQEFPRPQAPRVILACALPKRSRFDDILEKCTELGVDEVVPLITARTEVAPSAEAAARIYARLNSIAISASKQCRRLWFPAVHPVMKFEAAVDLLAKEKASLFIPWLEGERCQLSAVSAQASAVSCCFFIGPEGDFTPAEAAYALARGAVPVSLGETVLRVETAAIAVAAYARFVMRGA